METFIFIVGLVLGVFLGVFVGYRIRSRQNEQEWKDFRKKLADSNYIKEVNNRIIKKSKNKVNANQ